MTFDGPVKSHERDRRIKLEHNVIAKTIPSWRIAKGMTERIATCACGRLSVACAGDPASISLCHCLECQKRTGSVYGIAAFFARPTIEVSGGYSSYTRPSDSGHEVTFHFCPRCGSTVFWEPARKPDHVAVAVGAFADPHFPEPAKSVYHQHRHSWVIDAYHRS